MTQRPPPDYLTLHATALALDDLEVHAHGVARTELRDVVADLHPLQALDNGHAGVSSWDESDGENSSVSADGAATTRDRRQSSIAAWSPDNRTGGTPHPRNSAGRV